MGIGEAVRDHVLAFFIDDGLVAARCPEWLQSSFTIFKTNAAKTKVMTCLPGKIRDAKMEEEYAAQQTGDAATAKCCRLNVKFVASALRLYLLETIWRHRKTSTSHLCSIRTWSQSKPLSFTMLRNCQPPAYTHTRCHSVAAILAPGSIYANIFLCDIPRILCVSRLRVPFPCRSAHIVDCRHRSRTLEDVITVQNCARGGGRGSVNMKLLCIPSKPSSTHFVRTGRNWGGWRFSSTWVG